MKREIVIATHNSDKKKEIKYLLSALHIRVLSLSDFAKIPQIREVGSTFEENALAKAVFCAGKTKKLSLADDSGLEVPFLGGIPGIRSARFAGGKASYDDNNRKLLRLLREAPPKKRKARFVCCIAIAAPQGETKVVKGTCSGRIIESARGRNGFGYDPIFIPYGYSKTFAEMGQEAKNKISHRSRALRKAKKVIAGYFLKYSE